MSQRTGLREHAVRTSTIGVAHEIPEQAAGSTIGTHDVHHVFVEGIVTNHRYAGGSPEGLEAGRVAGCVQAVEGEKRTLPCLYCGSGLGLNVPSYRRLIGSMHVSSFQLPTESGSTRVCATV